MAQFIGDHRGAHGVEPICNVLPIAPATHYEHLAKRANPAIYCPSSNDLEHPR